MSYNSSSFWKVVHPMSFKTNDCQQLSLDDSFMTLTERERKALEKSWAKIFADEIFPAIDEERFSVLYSDKASRPNAPCKCYYWCPHYQETFWLFWWWDCWKSYAWSSSAVCFAYHKLCGTANIRQNPESFPQKMLRLWETSWCGFIPRLRQRSQR